MLFTDFNASQRKVGSKEEQNYSDLHDLGKKEEEEDGGCGLSNSQYSPNLLKRSLKGILYFFELEQEEERY